jgi:hypothetical protein
MAVSFLQRKTTCAHCQKEYFEFANGLLTPSTPLLLHNNCCEGAKWKADFQSLDMCATKHQVQACQVVPTPH